MQFNQNLRLKIKTRINKERLRRMSKGLQNRFKLHKLSKKWLCLGACAVIGIGTIGGFTFAKYYANNSNKGVTAASNYYFTSNLLGEALTEEEGQWKTVYNTDPWDGQGQYPFELRIQNYQNQLLYNDENLSITYKITFELLEDDGGSYAVQHGTETSKSLSVGNPVTYENLVIEGGMARFDDFDVLFNAPADAGEDYQSAGVQVVAEITAPDYLTTIKRQIGGILHIGVVKADYSLQGGYDFSVSLIDNTWSEADRATVEAMAAFPYSISYTPGADNAAHEVQINWDSSVLQLNEFDENYSKITQDEATGQATLKITIQPHETLQLIFYRADGFDMEQITPMDFHKLIEINDLDNK